MKSINRIFWGILLVLAGVIFALNALKITDIDIFFDGWWAILFLVIPGVSGLITEKSKTGNLIVIAIGVILFLACQDVLPFDMLWKLILPVLIIVFGLRLIFRSSSDRETERVIRQLKATRGESKAKKEYCATFSGQNLNFEGEVFESAELTAVFGGIECDLRGAAIHGDAFLELCAVFGGIDVFLPEGVNIKLNGSGLFGGVSDKVKRPFEAGRPTLYIRANCIFGGVDLK